MPNYTPGEIELITQIQGAITDPTKSPGSGFSVPLMLAIFARVVTLRDFATAQLAVNAQLAARVTTLETQISVLNGNKTNDAAEVYLTLIPDMVEEPLI